MVKRFLVCSKVPYLVGAKPDPQLQQAKAVEVAFPIEDFWKLEEIVKHMEFIRSGSESVHEKKKASHDLYVFCLPFVVTEKDRLWLASVLAKK